jgi:type III pantothenate kinase
MIKKEGANGCAIASVVPETTRSVGSAIRRICGIQPLVINHRTTRGIRFSYKKPATLGADRIANIVGGLARYGRNIIVVDCGTAVTIDIGLRSGIHKGGIIFPGMQMMLDALTRDTAILKHLTYMRPRKRIGDSTDTCMRSGVHYGSIAAIDGMVKMYKRETAGPCVCIATGGWGKVVNRLCPSIEQYDRSLTLYGVLKVYQSNVR